MDQNKVDKKFHIIPCLILLAIVLSFYWLSIQFKQYFFLPIITSGVVIIIYLGIARYIGNNINTITAVFDVVVVLIINLGPFISIKFKTLIDEIYQYLIQSISFLLDSPLLYAIFQSVLIIVLSALVGLIVFLTRRLFSDQTAMGKYHGKPLNILSDNIFLEKRRFFCNHLLSDLTTLETSNNWNDYYFTPLNAEVIINKKKNKKRTSKDLMRVLHSTNRCNSFLLLGAPGSGKSTVLRKLAKDLIAEVSKTNKIPIYINLKEWDVQRASPKAPPKISDFLDFIKGNLNSRFDSIFAYDFIKDYFDILFENGLLFFIFDSFDEIPILLDEPETSWLVKDISLLIYKAISINPNTKGILASRYFRKPTSLFSAQITLEIQPFSNDRMQKCLFRLTDSKHLASILYNQRRDLLSVARNPFNASLLGNYYVDLQMLPQNEAELFRRFIESRINKCEEAYQILSNNNTNVEGIVDFAQKIAVAIFEEPQYGIEIPASILIGDYNIPAFALSILQTAKLIRTGGGQHKLISFSHRRFNEYLVATHMLESDISVYADSIPEDSKWRDVLVLYAQICSEEKATELAGIVCGFIGAFKVEEGRSAITEYSTFYPALHALRFLSAAFVSRKQLLTPFQETIGKFIKELRKQQNVFFDKIIALSIPIIPEDGIIEILFWVLRNDINWVTNDALLGCSYLNQLPHKITSMILKHYAQFNPISFIKNFRENRFFLSQSRKFFPIKTGCDLHVCSILLFCIGILINTSRVFFNQPTSTESFFASISFIILLSVILELVIFRNRPTLYIAIIRSMPVILVLQYVVKPVSFMSILSLPIFSTQTTYIFTFSDILISISFLLSLYCYRLLQTIFYMPLKRCITLLSNLKRPTMKSIRRFIIMFASFLGVCMLIWFLLKFIIIIGILGILIVIFGTITQLFHSRHDSRIFDGLTISKTINRSDIKTSILSFRTSNYQMKYLMLLDENNVDAIDVWPDGLPKLKSGACAEQLGKLESKWIGLGL